MAVATASEQYRAWGEALAAKLRATGADRASLEAERIAALWKANAPLAALQAQLRELQQQLVSSQRQVWMCCRMLHAFAL